MLAISSAAARRFPTPRLTATLPSVLFSRYRRFSTSPGPPGSAAIAKDLQDPVDVWADKKLIAILDHFDAPIRCAAGYGSGVFSQIGYDDSKKAPMVDLIFGVSHPEHWHDLNIKQNPEHYSFLASWGGAKAVATLQEKVGSGMYFNPDVEIDGMRIKYGVISMKHLIQDLTEWKDFYVAGRLQKPIKILRGDSRVKLSNEQNLINALRVALLLLPAKFTEKQLYMTIVGLSYLGDFRMTFGENPRKIQNIVNAQMMHLRALYRPVMEKLGGCVAVAVPGGELDSTHEMMFEQAWDVKTRGALLLELPKSVRDGIVSGWQLENGTESSGMPLNILERLEFSQKVVASPKIGDHVKKAIGDIVRIPAMTQSMKGLITAGPSKSFRYVGEKLSKRK
ncbi:Mitochondrial translocator assembly and maintenance protein 41 [Podochytrium sp. JEL0797]|nr:Mitochondrial translocator assembly and maintenance protein 41 [Podochytrium sp. JEL0797]